MKFGSVCSGISAASVSWSELGWKAAWFHEIEPAPSAVLAARFPDVVNHGDMTAAPERIRAGELEAPELLCGGTPCQAFSVAGDRKSLDDARGNLSLIFCEIANEIDDRRHAAGQPPCIVFWENVPGVLNTKDNAFGHFLASLAGEDDALVPAGSRWTNAGVVLGPKRAVAWRVVDAQFFGLAQRRRRVFVVASAREGFDPGAVLFEFEGVRRDSPPSREPLQDDSGSTGDGLARCLTTGEMKRQDWETCNFLVEDIRVRRLTAVECERLQGFPDGHTDTPLNGKPMPDGWRYFTIGNSWAVNCTRWLGRRIQSEINSIEDTMIRTPYNHQVDPSKLAGQIVDPVGEKRAEPDTESMDKEDSTESVAETPC